MKKNIKIFLRLFILIFIFSCDDIIEEDISDDSVLILSPTDGSVVVGNNVQFLWQNLDGADDYTVQVLNDNQAIVLDSTVSSNEFIYNLNAGNYQWRVRGENFAYNTDYTFPVNFSVEESEDLTNQSVILSTPSNGLYTNNSSFTFTWNTMAFADSYTFELTKILNGETTVFQASNILSTSITLDPSLFDVDAEYIWKVKAVNNLSESDFSIRTIYLDRVVPNQPTLNSPTDNDTSSYLVTFNWSNGSDTGNIQSAITNTIQVSTDINFNTLLLSEDTQNNSYQYTFSDEGDYYWRVKAHDSAGNEGENSILRTITIEE